MADKKFTEFPSVVTPTTADLIWAVQAGADVKETLGQVISLALATNALTYAGDPNGNLAGTIYQTCWDSVNKFLWVCTTTGSTSTAVWEVSMTLSPDIPVVEVTGTTAVMQVGKFYIANNAAQVSLELPATSALGDLLEIAGKGAGGWRITQLINQQIIVGSNSSTVGVAGYLESTNRRDSIVLKCVVANTTWEALGGPQGSLTII